MRVAVCFLAFIIGYTYATTCTTTSDCDTTLTSCTGHGWTLTCQDTGTSHICTCVHGNGQVHSCTAQSDCTALHTCNGPAQWHCVDQHCTCGGNHQGGHHPPGGHGN